MCGGGRNSETDGEKSEIWNISFLFARQQDSLGETDDQIGPFKKNQNKKKYFFERSELAPLIELTEESQRRQGRPPEVKVVPLRENTAWQDWSWT